MSIHEQFSAKVVEHSVSSTTGIELVTFQLRYPRFIHAEVMTHRVFSRNAASSRAIPVKTLLSQVWNNPAMPIHWGQNQPGMQAKSELPYFKRKIARFLWRTASKLACGVAWSMMKVGLHKQVANRILEPFMFMEVVLTTTELDNWNQLRLHEDAQPEIYQLAAFMRTAKLRSVPVELSPGQWHLPYVTEGERQTLPLETLLKISTARCARVSFLTHDKKFPSVAKDCGLYDRLVGSEPLHASPTEHQATPLTNAEFNNNLRGWFQHRTKVEQSIFTRNQND